MRFESYGEMRIKGSLLDELRTGLVVSSPGDDAGGDLRSLPANPGTESAPDRTLVLERAAWEQIRQAEALYAAGGGTLPESGRVTIRIAPMRWRTIVLASGPALAALRRVVTPDGPIVQGFVIEPGAAGESLGNETLFEPESSLRTDRVGVAVGDTGWVLSTDASPEVAIAAEAGDRLVRDFRRRFGVVAAALALLAVAVVTLVAQADRLARQRAREAAAAAHELRTPLASVRLHAEMLEEALPEDGRLKSWAARLSSESARLGRQVANMLDLSRMERGGSLVDPQPADANAALTDCLGRLQPAPISTCVSKPERISPSSWWTLTRCVRSWTTSSTTRNATPADAPTAGSTSLLSDPPGASRSGCATLAPASLPASGDICSSRSVVRTARAPEVSGSGWPSVARWHGRWAASWLSRTLPRARPSC